ncbi:helicase C-terminal domain protein [Mycobacterium parascrofulaceum ATCC BAA-614]|uniref:Helicase C-terminal domain protein n=2 Tax=Mycobacterium parascrofulaceum TaxID=240125 RepID=D5P7D3_9MYCO|nr:helicase C-terminal domain protein [Mycobacterium parascrofulaceum ATCC BAA-614]
MGLRDLGIATHYRSGSENIGTDFYLPCLGAASAYDRAVGFFTSTSLAAAARGLKAFVSRPDTKMRLIASPALTEEDATAIAAGYDRREVIERALLRELDQPAPDALSQRLQLLTWLIAHGRLEIKLAVVSNKQGIGIYHEKVGLFRDTDGDTVVFTGSSNESASGLLNNFESIEVFRSWIDGERERVYRRVSDFTNLWNDNTPGLQVLDFPEALQRKLLQKYAPADDIATIDDGVDEGAAALSDDGGYRRPPTLKLRDYQKDAIRAWWKENGRGIWEMATGTGKTVTALAAVEALWGVQQNKDSLLVVVTVPYKHLAEQWAAEARKFGANPILAYDDASRWIPQMEAAVAALSPTNRKLILVIAVNRTFCGSKFIDRLRAASCTKMLICDEAHTAGSKEMRAALPDDITFRLGLSATPERHLDPEGTQAIRYYFGKSVYQLGLKQAIQLGALVPYRYHPIIVELTPEEHDKYVELTEKISQLLGIASDVDPDGAPTAVEMLLFQRARLIGSASGKVPALVDAITPHVQESYILVYCADRCGDDPQLDQVVRALGRDLRMRINTFTAEEDSSTRAKLLTRFSSGELQALAAIRCLDEGVDIPATRRAYILASSQNPRQFIQRRGRVLRPAPGKTTADIYDLMVSPPDLSDDPRLFELERRLVGRELMRATELCDAAVNSIDALSTLRPLRARYDLLSLAPRAEQEA